MRRREGFHYPVCPLGWLLSSSVGFWANIWGTSPRRSPPPPEFCPPIVASAQIFRANSNGSLPRRQQFFAPSAGTGIIFSRWRRRRRGSKILICPASGKTAPEDTCRTANNEIGGFFWRKWTFGNLCLCHPRTIANQDLRSNIQQYRHCWLPRNRGKLLVSACVLLAFG